MQSEKWILKPKPRPNKAKRKKLVVGNLVVGSGTLVL